jgi:hypothetical protein
MTDQFSFPPMLDLSPGEVEVHKQHLVSEISQRPERRRLSLPGAPLRPRFALPALGAVGAAVILAATPAWALVRDALPFWSQPSAPQSVKVDFSTLNSPAAPPGMNPKADVANTREVMTADFGGKTHTLYVSPAKNSGYCFEWSDSVGGCNTVPDQFPLDVSATIVPPHDASQPPQTVIPQSEMQDLHQHGVTPWLAVDAASPTVAQVVIHFSDGTTVQPEITWVSDPINAGFFAYQVPNNRQSATDHVTEVDAYDASGNLVERQPMAPMTSPIRPDH